MPRNCKSIECVIGLIIVDVSLNAILAKYLIGPGRILQI